MNAQVSVGDSCVRFPRAGVSGFFFFFLLDVGVGTELGSSAEYVAPTS